MAAGVDACTPSEPGAAPYGTGVEAWARRLCRTAVRRETRRCPPPATRPSRAARPQLPHRFKCTLRAQKLGEGLEIRQVRVWREHPARGLGRTAARNRPEGEPDVFDLCVCIRVCQTSLAGEAPGRRSSWSNCLGRKSVQTHHRALLPACAPQSTPRCLPLSLRGPPPLLAAPRARARAAGTLLDGPPRGGRSTAGVWRHAAELVTQAERPACGRVLPRRMRSSTEVTTTAPPRRYGPALLHASHATRRHACGMHMRASPLLLLLTGALRPALAARVREAACRNS